jgi:uncharacterized protein (DUF111 family)
MKIENIGYGAGDKDFQEQGNILRLIVGDVSACTLYDQVDVVETNLDNTTGEVIGHTTRALLDAGALDVYTTAIQMKKNRPATKLTVLCTAGARADMEAILFRETRTLGIRHWTAQRSILAREAITVSTPWGEVSGKRIANVDGSVRFSPEYEDCAALARAHNVGLHEVRDAAVASFVR